VYGEDNVDRMCVGVGVCDIENGNGDIEYAQHDIEQDRIGDLQ